MKVESENGRLLDLSNAVDHHVIEQNKSVVLDSPEILASDEIRNVEITIEHENVGQSTEYPSLKPLERFNRLDGDHVIEKSGK